MRRWAAASVVALMAVFVLPLAAWAVTEGSGSSASLSCPLPSEDAVTADISSELMLAWEESRSTAGPVPIDLPPGTYRVELVSYDDHSNKTHQSQLKEQWFLKGYDGTGAEAFVSGTTPDLPETVDIAVFDVGAITTSSQVVSIQAFHAAFPDAFEPHSVAPLCVRFSGQATSSASISVPPPAEPPPTPTGEGSATSLEQTTPVASSPKPQDTTPRPKVDTPSEASGTITTETVLSEGLDGGTAQSLQQLPLTGIELETAFLAIVALMLGVLLVRRARALQARLDRRAARIWRRPKA